ncbi:MAG: SDR family NAD(P)-dependent oxidoreductase [Ignavibacteriales bacterium]|nr:SDR family NAD(P)-dependent oxidoreductase [Ignavibacteriales bacterium]
MNLGLQGKVIVVTGASKGIGKATALAFAEEGCRLALCARDEHELKLTADYIQMHLKTDVIAVKTNLTRLNDIRRFVTAIIKKFNRIDVLINNAGGAHVGGIVQTTDDDWEQHIQLKLLGYIKMAREVIPHMRKNGGGKIINIIGTAGKEPTPHFMVPGVTNAGLMNFTKSLAKELEPDNITVNALNPGTTDTPLTHETFKSLGLLWQKTPEEVRKIIESQLPQNRLATAEEIARVAVLFGSDSFGFINGVSLNIDAGKTPGLF